MDASQEDSVSNRPTDAPEKYSMPNKRSVNNPNAPPLSVSGAKFDFEGGCPLCVLFDFI